MKRPSNMEQFKPIDPKLGIKSSLPNAKSTIAFVILLWLSDRGKYEIEYCKSDGGKICISDACHNNMIQYLRDNLDVNDKKEEEVVQCINGNQLFQSQLEVLIVALELVWKIASIKFKVSKKADSAERSGKVRYEKVLHYTSNIDLFDVLVHSNKKYCQILYTWLVGEKTTDNLELEKQLIRVINYLSDDAALKMNDGGKEIFFNMSSVYEKISEKEDEVDINGDVEAKGALRVVKGTLSEGLNYYLAYKKGVVSLAENVKYTDFSSYSKRVRERQRISKVNFSIKSKITDKEEEKNVDLFPQNRIIFGAPGTGKSHRLEIDSRQFDGRVERVTFHPNYSYAQFVGTYKPVMEIREDKKEISYKYVPGPFMRVYLNAKKNMLLQEEYKDIACRKVYYEPATDMDHWNLFDEVQNIGDMEDFTATKDMEIGDIALIYIGNNDYGYERGVYAIAKVISEPEIDDSEEDGKPRVWLRFDKISYDKPIISKEILDLYNTQYQSVHGIKDGQKLLQDISFGEENELLIIEEINRANVAAVFGDVFQLLDRKDGVSEYAIATSEDMRQFLDDELRSYDVDNSKMEIPSNMYIWATMNSADQGVFPMDTAFKRRWEFEYISVNDENQVHAIEDYEIPMCANKSHKYYVNWNDLRAEINTILIDNCKVNEDKLLGPFFISKNMLDDIKSNKDQIDRIQAIEEALRSDEDNKTLTKAHQNEISFMKAFESKVIMYLFEDVMKMRAERIFAGYAQKNRKMIFSEICEAFEEEGEKIFGIKSMDPIQG